MRIALAAILGILLACGAARAASCPDGQELPRIANKRIVLADDTLFFASRGLQLDHDGSPEAYGVRDQGLEGICNGLAPLRHSRVSRSQSGACFKTCQSAFAAWSRNGAQVETLGDSMCSIGLGGGGCSPPSVRLQPPPRQDWFVSETSVRVAPPTARRLPAGTLRRRPSSTQRAYPISSFPAPSVGRPGTRRRAMQELSWMPARAGPWRSLWATRAGRSTKHRPPCTPVCAAAPFRRRASEPARSERG
ncbi:MAG: hypothetical protein IPK78_19510 [Rhodospirillales bacterium]|nr:hypothetical protein [Rhodospirillales bacterium]